MKLTPVNNHIIVKEIKIEKKGLAEIDNPLETEAIGEIVAVPADFGPTRLAKYKPKSKILFNDYEAIDVPKMKGIDDNLLIISIDDVLAIINE